MFDKAWVHLNRATDEYMEGARNFLQEVKKRKPNANKMLCPCKDCRNMKHFDLQIIHEHLVIKGMDPTYNLWYHHGEVCEEDEVENEVDDTFMFEATNIFKTMYMGEEENMDHFTSKKSNKFSHKVQEANTPLYARCTKYTKMSATVALYKLKTFNGWSDTSFSSLLELLYGMLPVDNVIPRSTYEVRKLFKEFDLGYKKIHACVKDCCLFRNENEKLESCPHCSTSRWMIDRRTNQVKQGVPAKVLRYFPIIPRLKRMFKIDELGENLRWHSNHKSTDGKIRHPVDSVAWESIDQKWPDFSMDSRNLRLGLATDGFNPFSNLSSRYSCWPVMLVTYNFPPWLCMKRENIMLTLLIPGPKQPGNDIDVYLQPLMEDLQQLWKGVKVYDVVSDSHFNLRAILMWTINDFPAYGNLAGCTTKGKYACPICGDNTRSSWLKYSKKFAYMGHRRFLSRPHPYRRKKAWFDGKIEEELPPKIATSSAIFAELEDFENCWGKSENRRSKSNKEESHKRWKKRSIFFDLPYWKELPVRHNLDVMHIEKNVCESILGTLLDINGKSKDGINSRKDLQLMKIRFDLHPQERGGRTYLPPAPHTLSKSEKKLLCSRLYKLKLPDGYSSNISKCVSLDDCKVMGLKSHDCHVLMQQLLSVVLRGLLPKGSRHAIYKLCSFFNRLCQRIIDREVMLELEKEAVDILCLLERYFPPSFFDIMIHLVIHLGREARICGPVQFRWMYPFERYMKVLKGYVRNKARPEGCIAACYLADECVDFSNKYFKQSAEIANNQQRNEEYHNDVILEGRPISSGTSVTLPEDVLENAHRYVLLNTAEVEPFIELHMNELMLSNKKLAKDASLLWKIHAEQFPSWLKSKIELDSSSENFSDLLKWLANGPRKTAMSYTGYIINGQRFHIKSLQRSTQNSGVSVDATTLCRSSAKDRSQVVNLVAYYGVLQEIILLDYYIYQLPIFKCDWANVRNGVRVEEGFTLVNLHQSQSIFMREPFIFASQAKQVFYVREHDTSNWYVLLKAPPRGVHDLDMYDENCSDSMVDNEPILNMFEEIDENDELTYARQDCEGILI